MNPRLQPPAPLYLAGLAALLAAAALLGGWLPRAACFLWIGAGLVDLAWAGATLRSLDLHLEPHEDRLTAGQRLTAEISARRLTRLPLLPVVLRDGPGSPLPVIRTPGGEALTVIRGAPPPPLLRRLPARRGRCRLGPLRAGATGPFGTVHAWAEVRSRREVLVLPRLWPLPLLTAEPAGRRSGGSAAGRGALDPAAVAGIRPLLPGDPPRHIHWSRSAATGAWQVKLFDRPGAAPLHVLLDLEAAAYDRPHGADLCDAAVEVAAALAGAALSHGRPARLRTTGAAPVDLALPPGGGSLRQLLAVLAEARPDGPRPIADHLELARGRLYLVTPAPPAAWGPLLAAHPRDGLRPSAVLVLGPDSDPAAAARWCAELRRLGIAAWAAAGGADLARQLAGAGV